MRAKGVCHHHAAACAHPQANGRDECCNGPQKVDGGKAHVANALADIKTVYNNEKACQKLRGHGWQHIMKKLCLRALYVRLHGGCSFLFRCGPGQARLKLPLCSARAVQAFVVNAQRGQAV